MLELHLAKLVLVAVGVSFAPLACNQIETVEAKNICIVLCTSILRLNHLLVNKERWPERRIFALVLCTSIRKN